MIPRADESDVIDEENAMSEPYNTNPYTNPNPVDPNTNPAGVPAQPAYGGVSGGVPGGVPGNPYVPGAAYQPYYQPEPRWNAMAIAGFVASFMVSIVGLVLSIIGLNQINRTGEKGRGLAIAGIIVGALSTLLSVILIVLVIASIAGAASHDYGYSYDDGDDGYGYYDDGEDVTNAADRPAAASDRATARLDAIVAATGFVFAGD